MQMFKPVRIAATPASPRRGGDNSSEGGIELHLAGERRVMVRRGFDRQLLLDLITALESLA
jgi:hypothetical protein